MLSEEEIQQIITFRRFALQYTHGLLDATVVHLKDGSWTFKAIRLDPGCTDFGKTLFTPGGSVAVSFDYERNGWYEVE